METAAWLEREEKGAPRAGAPYLSHSRINRYLHCPEQYRLYYVENLRLRVPSANLLFGQAVHQALAVLFRHQDDPVTQFLSMWGELQDTPLTFSQRDSWEKLRETGERLLGKFVEEEAAQFTGIQRVEKPFELQVTTLDLPIVGVIDLVATVRERLTVVDFKTSSSAYADHEVALSDQLTAYRLAEPEAEKLALCVLVKTKEPRIEWQFAERSGEDLRDYLAKAGYVGSQIPQGVYYKRPGKWCSYCDYLPVCLKDWNRVEERLVQITPPNS